ncbi:hypothetical protein J3E72DRAFT_322357 [Bipolaris maydis]|uniref:uncharacterized protein n=1 Tax=Cochliobolus heterostrophus TaxID=5016 RepID=UPI0024DA5CC9|nr:hypothetical protein J3E73DRAFT_307241 [Bipolaris maydis]KAJ5059688.1 hypothetical protein J3E74DRAFT_349820 [Bipolaris maydis]KAJ6197345.1 hypothetical protein J3E72DRAFT_322357 [Bipolaris maydis]KAJ6271338.1 hypothetical protein PSV08DRAFT_293083 [Bipolaris maydis]KAJ6282607.1 hypothetical protein J3E71DRAFT_287553 [Bipolaris maydis]
MLRSLQFLTLLFLPHSLDSSFFFTLVLFFSFSLPFGFHRRHRFSFLREFGEKKKKRDFCFLFRLMIMTGALALHGSLTIFSFFFLPCDCHFLDLPIYLVFSFCFGSRKPPLVCVQASTLISSCTVMAQLLLLSPLLGYAFNAS